MGGRLDTHQEAVADQLRALEASVAASAQAQQAALDSILRHLRQSAVSHDLTAATPTDNLFHMAIPMDNLYCSCKLTRCSSEERSGVGGPASAHVQVMAYSCNPYAESLLPRPAPAIPMENPHCSCKLTRGGRFFIF